MEKEKIDADKFINEMIADIEVCRPHFIGNFPNTSLTYCEWMDIFVPWMEWSNPEDCEKYYG